MSLKLNYLSQDSSYKIEISGKHATGKLKEEGEQEKLRILIPFVRRLRSQRRRGSRSIKAAGNVADIRGRHRHRPKFVISLPFLYHSTWSKVGHPNQRIVERKEKKKKGKVNYR